jgi:N-(2-amino-2-carboxyethyl)-L-glutamate synthase
MPIISIPQAFNEEELYVDLRSIFGHSLFLKCEGFNFAGSVKLKAASEMVEAAERDGVLKPGWSILVESSSGNLGVALSMIAASKGYRFLCVTDLRCNLSTRRLMAALGSQVHVITEPDANGGGLLGARLAYIRALCASDDRYVWLNQYTNENNWKAHYRTTAPAIAGQFPRLDVLFIGAGTTGTLMGCARYFREWHPSVRIVAVDTVGSVTFGGAPGRRMIPGLGMAVPPPLLDKSYVDEVVRVEEVDTVRACHRLARRGFLFGGSTGTVVSGAMRWLAQHDGLELTAVAISPDLGERYLDTVYQPNWLQDVYGEDVLSGDFDERSTDSWPVSLTGASDALTGPAAAPAA